MFSSCLTRAVCILRRGWRGGGGGGDGWLYGCVLSMSFNNSWDPVIVDGVGVG